MSDISPRVHIVDWEGITIEELKEYKMELGSAKHGDPNLVDYNALLMDFIRKMGEFMVALGSGDYKDSMEAIADISNVGDILFGKIQDDYIESLNEETPECFGTEEFDSLECRAKICAWREECGNLVAAERAKFLREVNVKKEQGRF